MKPDNLYTQIDQESKRAHIARIVDKRKKTNEAAIKSLKIEEARRKYSIAFENFYGTYDTFEKGRAQGYDMLLKSELMSKYMVEITQEEFNKARE